MNNDIGRYIGMGVFALFGTCVLGLVLAIVKAICLGLGIETNL